MAIGIGDTLKDNDPRSKGRMLYVRKVDATHVWAATQVMGTRLTKVSKTRIHEDDKPRRTGYSRIQPVKLVSSAREGGRREVQGM